MADGTGIGFEVVVPLRSIAASGTEVRFFTSLQFGNDGALLAGFETLEERRVFDALLNVNGVGPRTAVRVLSTHSASKIFEALDAEDPKPFQAVPGIGGKTANRIILELRGKLVPANIEPTKGPNDDESQEVLEALLSLAFSRPEAIVAMNQTAGDDMPVVDRISAALRDLASKRSFPSGRNVWAPLNQPQPTLDWIAHFGLAIFRTVNLSVSLV